MRQESLSFFDLGICNYKIALAKQKDYWQKRVNSVIPNTLIFVEHPPVFTIGKHGNKSNLLITESLLDEKNIQLYRIDRGGDITFHGPGQLIGYPIFMLNNPLIGLKKFIHKIEECLCNSLKAFNINAITKYPSIGVWVENKKIASIGIAVAKRVSYHGFALNISTDLSYFRFINPCGIQQIEMTSMNQILEKNISTELVKIKVKNEFMRIFS